MDFPVRDVAEQLTRLDAVGLMKPHFKNVCVTVGASLVPFLSQELFVKVVPFHCLGCIWSQRDKKENRNLAPTVRATISQFNAVTNRVITSLLCPFAPGPSSSSPVSSPSSSSSSTFPYPSADLNSPDSAQTSPAHRARIIERWISIAQVWNLIYSFGLFIPRWNYIYFLLGLFQAAIIDILKITSIICDINDSKYLRCVFCVFRSADS